MIRTGCIVGLLSLAWSGVMYADPPANTHVFWHGWFQAKTCPSVGCCRDDYVRKPCPPISPLPRCGGADDYCRKPMVFVPPPACGGVDDYCRKPFPYLLCPPLSPYLRCGTPDAACGKP